jgi:hypothetical protein
MDLWGVYGWLLGVFVSSADSREVKIRDIFHFPAQVAKFSDEALRSQ